MENTSEFFICICPRELLAVGKHRRHELQGQTPEAHIEQQVQFNLGPTLKTRVNLQGCSRKEARDNNTSVTSAGEAIMHSHPSREPKIDDSGILLVSVSVFLSFFFFSAEKVCFHCTLSKNVLSSQGKDSSAAALEPNL